MHNVNLIIIGAAKAGTTSVFDMLAKSEEVCQSNAKELAFFNRAEEMARGIEHYHASFPDMSRRYVMEATPEYAARMVHPDVAKLIHGYNPGAKLIFCARDPMHRIASQYIHFNQLFPQAYVSPGSVFYNHIGLRNLVFRSLYDFNIGPFRHLFGDGNIFVFDLDDATSSSRLGAWLGIDVDGLPVSNARNAPTDERYVTVLDAVKKTSATLGYDEMIRDDVSRFSDHYGVGANWSSLR